MAHPKIGNDHENRNEPAPAGGDTKKALSFKSTSLVELPDRHLALSKGNNDQRPAMSDLITAILQKVPLEVLKRIDLACPGSLQERDENGWTPLHHATFHRSPPEVIRFLVGESGDGAQQVTTDGRLPLHFAAKCDPPDEIMVQFLVKTFDKGILQKDAYGRLPLHVAIANDAPMEVVESLVDKDRKVLEEADNDGWLPLHYAAFFCESSTMVRFLCRPQHLRAKVKGGRLPLHLAVQRESLEVVQYLANEYAQALQEKDEKGWLPLHFAACSNTMSEVIRFLAKNRRHHLLEKIDNGQKNALHLAAQHGVSWEVVEFLATECQEAVHETDANGQLPLHLAARFASPEVNRILVSVGSLALKCKDKAGKVPLHIATQFASWKVVRLLVGNEPGTLRAKDNSDALPLHVAAQFASAEVVQGLMKRCSSAQVEQTRDGLRPVDVARKHSRPDVASLLERGMQEHRSHNLETSASTQQDSHRVREVIVAKQNPVVVSASWVQSILTETILGAGRFGKVLKGKDSTLDLQVAVKCINPLILSGGDEREVKRALRTFATEQKALSRFRHPNIVALLAYTDLLVEGSAYLVFELAEKGSLDKFLTNDLGRSRLGTFYRRVRIAVDVFTAIRFLHVGNQDITKCFHRDVKSANIVLKRDFTAQLVDCGIAKFVFRNNSDSSSTFAFRGTPAYSCPQYALNAADYAEYNESCDIYSFGVVLTELWTGMLQNSSDETGNSRNFRMTYVLGKRGIKRDIVNDVDHAIAFDGGAQPQNGMHRFAHLALECMAEDQDERPPGEGVLKELQSILPECAPNEDRKQYLKLNDEVNYQNSDQCAYCRTHPTYETYQICLFCIISEAIKQNLDPLAHEIRDIGRNVTSANQVLARLDRRFSNEVPRLFILIPADSKRFRDQPIAWLKSKGFTKYYLFFVCEDSHEAVSPPIKLKVAKEWVQKLAPVLRIALLFLQASIKVALNVSLDLNDLMPGVSTSGVIECEVTASQIANMLEAVSKMLAEGTTNDGLTGSSQSTHSQKLIDDAYELVREKAHEQRGWRSKMEPVRKPHGAEVFWVTRAVALDSARGYEIVEG